MKSLLCFVLLFAPALHAHELPASPESAGTAIARQDGEELSGISFTITYSNHDTANYSEQAKAIADALTAAGAKVRLQSYNSKTREGVYGYYGKTEADKIETVRKLVSKVLDVKFEHSKAYDEPGANPNRMIMINLIRNKAQ